jgi:excisionase family DNA binding protein
VTLLTAEDVAASLDKSVEWVKRSARAGHISYVRVGQTMRFTQADIDDYISRQRKAPAAQPKNPWGVRTRRRSA